MIDRVTFSKEEYKDEKIRIYITFDGLFQSNFTGDDDFKSDIDCLERAKNNIDSGNIKIKKSGGYILIRCPDHPFLCANRYILKHRVVLEEYLRKNEPNHPALIEINGIKYLSREWVVHHWSERKTDNRPEYLEAAIPSVHNSLHKMSELVKYLEKTGKSAKELFKKQELR